MDRLCLIWFGTPRASGKKTTEQVYTLIRSGRLDGVVRRVGRRLVASLVKHFTEGAAP
jgi:hypothetical protein